MKLLDKLVLKDLLPMFFIGITMFTSLFFAADPVLQASQYWSQGVPLPLVLRLVVLKLPWILGLTFPMGILLAVLLGFGRLSGESEAVALFAGGIPFLRVTAPAVALGLAASLCGYVINDRVATAANQRLENLREQIGTLLHDQPETTQPFHFEDRKEGVLRAAVQVEKGFDLRARAMREVTLTFYDEKGLVPVAVFHASRGQWRGGNNWELTDVTTYYLGPLPRYAYLGRMESSDLPTDVLAKTPSNFAFLQRSPDTLTFHDLRRKIALLREMGTSDSADLRDAELGLWSKIALPFASLVFALVAAPLALRPQRSANKYTGWALAVLIIFIYYVLYMTMSSLARGGGCPPVLAAFLPNMIGLLAGSYLTWKAAT